ncbi:MAG: hypothetical protein HYV35_09270 [Lentisphaerae bacterium]|nr:hypothetical protein [Lentisphaerota bacterium]
MLPAGVIAGLMLLGGILTGARIHGFSFSAWHSIIDGSPPNEVLLNKVNRWRQDDWSVMLPHMLAQRVDQPPFAVHNRLIGDGHYNMRVAIGAPVRDLFVLFRPQVWGYFISGDIGMAFQWWFYALGTWITAWLLLRRLTNNDEGTSACGATALLFSPFFQAWSLNCAPSTIFAGGTLLALMLLRAALSPFKIILAASLFAWCGAAFLLTFNYMPYLITLLYFIVFVFAGIALTRQNHDSTSTHSREAPRPHSYGTTGMRWVCALLAFLGILGLGTHLIASNWETIELVRNTVYPGQRLSTGGDQTIGHLLRGNIFNIIPPADWWGFRFPCEGAAFFVVFPLVFAAIFRDWWRTRRPPSALVLGISSYIVFLLLWYRVGFPEFLAKWTLLNRAPPFRTLIGFGIADIFLLCAYISHRQQLPPPFRNDYITPWIASAFWIAFHVALGVLVSSHAQFYLPSLALISGLFAMVLAPLLYLAPRLVLPAIMIASILTTYSVNPLARGGTTFIQENPLSQKIKALDQEAKTQGRQALWIVYGDRTLPNLLRMLGSRSLNGVHAYPQFELWKKLDPDGQFHSVYNRYAHVFFSVPPEGDDLEIKLTAKDCVGVFLHPDNPRFAALKADYLLCPDNHVESFDRLPRLKKIYSYAGKHIYQVRFSLRSVPVALE